MARFRLPKLLKIFKFLKHFLTNLRIQSCQCDPVFSRVLLVGIEFRSIGFYYPRTLLSPRICSLWVIRYYSSYFENILNVYFSLEAHFLPFWNLLFSPSLVSFFQTLSENNSFLTWVSDRRSAIVGGAKLYFRLLLEIFRGIDLNQTFEFIQSLDSKPNNFIPAYQIIFKNLEI